MKRLTHIAHHRVVIFALVAMLLPSSLGSGMAQESTPTASAVQRLDEPVTLTMYSSARISEVGPPPEDWFWYQEVEEALNITIELELVFSDYTGELQTRAVANDLPDIFHFDTNTASLFADQGLLADWNPYLESMPTFVAERDVTELAPIGTYDDGLYSLVTRSPEPFRGMVVIRQDWLNTLGLEAPTTLDEYLAVMKAFTEQDPDGNGMNDTYGWSGSVTADGAIEQFNPIFGAFGALGQWNVADGQLQSVSTSPERRDALAFISRMDQEGVLDPDWQAQSSEDWALKWKSGRIGIFPGDVCAVFCIQGYADFLAANPDGQLSIIAPPTGPDGQSAVGTYSTVGYQYGMSARAEEEGKGEAIARLLEWIHTDGYLPTAYGRDGIDFTRNEDGSLLHNPAKESLPYRQLIGWGYKGAEGELFARYGQDNEFANGEIISVFDVLQEIADSPYKDVTEFTALPPVPPEVAADLTRTIAQGEFDFATGRREPSEWDAHVETVNNVGMETWIDTASERAQELGLLP